MYSVPCFTADTHWRLPSPFGLGNFAVRSVSVAREPGMIAWLLENCLGKKQNLGSGPTDAPGRQSV